MRKTMFIWFVFLIVSQISAQSIWNDRLYDSVTVDNFRSFKPFKDTIDIKNFDVRLVNAAVFYATNEIRIKKKLSVLPHNKNLEVAAYFHSKDMADRGYFNHINSKDKKRKTPNDRSSMAGIINPYAAENITEGFVLDYKANSEVYPRGKGKFSNRPKGELIKIHTYIELADKLLDAWMNSPPHKENIVSKNNKELGCGVEMYIDNRFNDMPMVKATQLFQQYVKVEKGNAYDRF